MRSPSESVALILVRIVSALVWMTGDTIATICTDSSSLVEVTQHSLIWSSERMRASIS